MNGNRTKGSFIGRLFAVSVAIFIFVALIAATGWGADHRATQARPISLGTSGGNIYDSTSRYCCSGTLGALVQDDINGFQYILSNNHVLARSNLASLGEKINQPGMIDQYCRQDGIVAELSAFKKIEFRTKQADGPTNQMDAAIARTSAGAVREDGDILGIGTVSGNTVLPFVGQQVQKSGRTTGHTFGEVAAVNVTVDVGYSTECGGRASQVARFVNQIRIAPGDFSAGGDSGSVIFESGAVDPADGRPRAVGLLFAGSSTSTLANPINAVLAAFGVSMVGGGAPPASGSISGVVTEAGAGIFDATVSTDTGQSTTTDNSGVYELANVPTGKRTVTASASGYNSQVQTASVVSDADTRLDFSLTKLTIATQSMVQCVTYDLNRNQKHMYVTISVTDDFGTPVANVQVSISLNRDGALYRTGTGTTDSSGAVTFTITNAPNGLYAATVTNVAASGLTFDGSTPANAFRKGSDTVPAVFCRTGATAASTAEDTASTRFKHAKTVLNKHSNALFNLPSAVGHGIGISTGRPVIEIYLANENASARSMAPAVLDGVPVRIIVTGPFKAY